MRASAMSRPNLPIARGLGHARCRCRRERGSRRVVRDDRAPCAAARDARRIPPRAGARPARWSFRRRTVPCTTRTARSRTISTCASSTAGSSRRCSIRCFRGRRGMRSASSRSRCCGREAREPAAVHSSSRFAGDDVRVCRAPAAPMYFVVACAAARRRAARAARAFALRRRRAFAVARLRARARSRAASSRGTSSTRGTIAEERLAELVAARQRAGERAAGRRGAARARWRRCEARRSAQAAAIARSRRAETAAREAAPSHTRARLAYPRDPRAAGLRFPLAALKRRLSDARVMPARRHRCSRLARFRGDAPLHRKHPRGRACARRTSSCRQRRERRSRSSPATCASSQERGRATLIEQPSRRGLRRGGQSRVRPASRARRGRRCIPTRKSPTTGSTGLRAMLGARGVGVVGTFTNNVGAATYPLRAQR